MTRSPSVSSRIFIVSNFLVCFLFRSARVSVPPMFAFPSTPPEGKVESSVVEECCESWECGGMDCEGGGTLVEEAFTPELIPV